MIERLGLTNLDEESPLVINGLDAHTGVSVVKSDSGPRPVRFTVVYHGQQAFTFAGMSRESGRFPDYDPAFLQTAGSFHKLTTEERAQAMPLRINVIRADANTRFSALASQSPVEKYPESQLRLLNAHYPRGEPGAGELIKIVK